MVDSYLVEYRYSGYPRKYFLNRYFELQREYRIAHRNYHYVPHITVSGPITAKNERLLVNELKNIIFSYSSEFHEPGNLVVTGKYIAFKTPRDGEVLAVEVLPPNALIRLKKDIDKKFSSLDGFSCQLYNDEIWHTTIWFMKNNYYHDKKKFDRVWSSMSANPQEMKFILDRLTLIKNGKILKEFDLVNNKILERIDSLNNDLRYADYIKLKQKLEENGENFFQSTKKDKFFERNNKQGIIISFLKKLFSIKEKEKGEFELSDPERWYEP